MVDIPEDEFIETLKHFTYSPEITRRTGSRILMGKETAITAYLRSIGVDERLFRRIGIEMLAMGKYIDIANSERN